MTDQTSETPKYIPLSVTVYEEQAERVKEMARVDKSNPSIIMRRILADYFTKLDAAQAAPTNGKTRKAAVTA